MLGTQRRLTVYAGALIVLLAAGLALAFSVQITGELVNQFDVRTELFARTFADQIQFRLGQPQDGAPVPVDLRAQIQPLGEDRVRGEVIYAQVVYDGLVLGEQRTYVVEQAHLDVTPQAEALVRTRRTLSSGVPYMDVRRALVRSPQPVDPDSYIRLGFSMVSLQHDTLNRVLQTVGWSALGAALGLGLLGVGFRQWQRAALAAAPGDPVPHNGAPALPAQAGARLIQCGDMVIDDEAKSVKLGDEEIVLSPREYELLKLLGTHPGKIFSNDEIVARVWNDDQFAIPQDVKKYVYLLRKKLEADPSRPRRLLTVRGFGYKLVPPAS